MRFARSLNLRPGVLIGALAATLALSACANGPDKSNIPNVGPCPPAHVLGDAARLVQFNGPEAFANVGFTGEVLELAERHHDELVLRLSQDAAALRTDTKHAEVNALLSAGQRAEGATIYVVGRPVCSACAGALIQAGIARVVAERPPAVRGGFDAAVKILTTAPPNILDSKIWDIKGLVAQHMFSHARVSFDTHPHSSFKKKVRRAKAVSRVNAPGGKPANNNKKETVTPTARRPRPVPARTAVGQRPCRGAEQASRVPDRSDRWPRQ